MRLTVNGGHLDFRCAKGAGGGDDTLPQVRLSTTENQDGSH